MGNSPEELMDEAISELNAAIGIMARATSSIDLYLCYLVAEIVHPVPCGQDLDLASVIIFSQGRIESRFDVARKILQLNLAHALEQKPHTYEYKLAAFLLKSFNKIADDAKEHAWVRNTVAHGAVLTTTPPTVLPQPCDLESIEKLERKRSQDRKRRAVESGFTAKELIQLAKEMRQAAANFAPLTKIVALLRTQAPEEALEQAVVQLGKDLKLTPPLRVRPHRKAKPKPARKASNPLRAG